MQIILSKLTSYILMTFFLACSADKEKLVNTTKTSISFDVDSIREEMAYERIQRRDFHKQILANGKIQSLKKADLRFGVDGIINQILVVEGQEVKQGQLLATLDSKQLNISLRVAQLNLKQAQLDYEDQILRSGYKILDSARISPQQKSVLRIRSGLERAQLELQQAEANAQTVNLYAPFSGRIAKLKAKSYNRSTSYDYICTVVSNREIEVIFSAIEQEIDFLKKARIVEVSPLGNSLKEKVFADVKSVSPVVDEFGLVEVRAQLRRGDEDLLDGMNVHVYLNQTISQQLVIPKTAVLDRQHRKVVFTLVGNLAKWNYVDIGNENADYFLVTAGLKEGDNVIYKGNYNLADNVPVSIQD